MTPLEFARILRAAADEAERIANEHRAERRDWTDQSASALGRRRHVAAVRRRCAVSDPGAAMLGRRALLSADALAAELAAFSRGPRKAKAEPDASSPEALRRQLGLVKGGGR